MTTRESSSNYTNSKEQARDSLKACRSFVLEESGVFFSSKKKLSRRMGFFRVGVRAHVSPLLHRPLFKFCSVFAVCLYDRLSVCLSVTVHFDR